MNKRCDSTKQTTEYYSVCSTVQFVQKETVLLVHYRQNVKSQLVNLAASTLIEKFLAVQCIYVLKYSLDLMHN